jgi:serine/threonine protein kinase
MQIDIRNSDLSDSSRFRSNSTAAESSLRWQNLCKVYLPFILEGAIWRFSRQTESKEPAQGWKLHISATVRQACDLFEKVAPFLVSKNLRFKAPESLRELIKLNSGLDYGYWQVGKFLTVYPSTETEAVELARELHELTEDFISIAIPFDNQYLPNSSIFYRYGAFEEIEMTNEDGLTLPAVRNLSGELVYDDCLQAVPEWMNDPFQNERSVDKDDSENIETPLVTTYKVFSAITQRGKGGTYRALDLSTNPPRFCIVKEGRKHGEVFWNGQDGSDLARNEQNVLETLGTIYKGVPQYFSSFEAFGNFYLVMEYVEGKSLNELMKFRQRRFSVKHVILYAVEIAGIIEEIHKAGWIWNDCKPANLIVTSDKSLRPIDFEGAYPINQTAPFDWRSYAFSKPKKNQSSSAADDLYALGAVIYFLLTGRYFNSDNPIAIRKLRRNVPEQLQTIIKYLLGNSASDKNPTASEIRKKLAKTLNSI